MNTDKERLKIALQILIEDLVKHKDWQDDPTSWQAVIGKAEHILNFVNKMKE